MIRFPALACASLALATLAGCAVARAPQARREPAAVATAAAPVPGVTLRVTATDPPATPGPHAAAPVASPGIGAPASPAVAAGPHILSVSATPSVVHDGESVTWLVRTTPDVTSVTAHVALYTLPLARVAPGRFGLSFGIPKNVPGFFHGTYDMGVTARTDAGATADSSISLRFE